MTEIDPFKTYDEPDEPAATLEPGTILANRYELIQQVGRGGMGVVWSAKDKTAERKVVLKFVPSEVKNFETAVAQLKASFKKIHELQHQHICPVYTLEEDVSLGYYHAMKWLDGVTLDQYILDRTPLPLDEVLRILQPVAEALDYAHSKKIIHRDIKPSNIFIVLDEEKNITDVQVIDFGLASEIRSSLNRVSQMRFDNAGTRPYMAPEQWRGRPQSGQADQYALAVVVYELLSGYLPFDSDDIEMLRLAVLQDMPEAIIGVPDRVNTALLKALAKDAGDRFPSCEVFFQALRTTKTQESLPTTQRPVSNTTQSGSVPIFAERSKSSILIVVVGLMVLSSIVWAGWNLLERAKEKRDITPIPVIRGQEQSAITAESEIITEVEQTNEPQAKPPPPVAVPSSNGTVQQDEPPMPVVPSPLSNNQESAGNGAVGGILDPLLDKDKTGIAVPAAQILIDRIQENRTCVHCGGQMGGFGRNKKCKDCGKSP